MNIILILTLIVIVQFILILFLYKRYHLQLRNLTLFKKEIEKSNSACEEVTQELNAVCYSVSHDLAAPIRAINGFCRILKTNYQSLHYPSLSRDHENDYSLGLKAWIKDPLHPSHSPPLLLHRPAIPRLFDLFPCS